MTERPKSQCVEVLLATYNGERFLREQIDSILNQDYPNLRVLARDDGSNDETVSILNEYALRFPDRFRITGVPGSVGAKDNFLLLMRESSAPYVCFADQDDVWLPDKVSKTTQVMQQLESRWGVETPLLVFTDLRVVDQQLRTLHESFWAYTKVDPNRIERLALLLSQNVVTGCTAMLNRRLLELSLRMPREAFMHDHWVSLLASTIGRAGAVRSQTVLYRQHDRNVLGVGKKTRSLAGLARRVMVNDGRQIQWETHQRQARAFLAAYRAELTEKDRDLLNAYLRCGTSGNRFARIATFIRYGFYPVGFMRKAALMIHLWRSKMSES